jgi:hypothetical protein
MRMRLMTLILCVAGIAAAAPALEVLRVGDYSISVGWDPAWKVGSPDKGAPPNTAKFQLKDPHDMFVQISAQARPADDADPDEFMRHVIDSAVKEFETSSVEKKLEPKSFRHGEMRGYSVCATDRAPKPDEFRNVCQGITTDGEVAVIYTVLYNDGGKASAEKAAGALEALQIAKAT